MVLRVSCLGGAALPSAHSGMGAVGETLVDSPWPGSVSWFPLTPKTRRPLPVPSSHPSSSLGLLTHLLAVSLAPAAQRRADGSQWGSVGTQLCVPWIAAPSPPAALFCLSRALSGPIFNLSCP